jgi:RimJ/RimL family protein N-acetyltransferase
MPFTLLPLTKPQLVWLAASREPEELQSQAEPGSMPPSFVAARSLKLGAEGNLEPWSSSFLIVRNEDARFVGACGFKTAPNAGRVEVGYGVSPLSRGNGAATAALRMLSLLAFEAGASEVLAEVLPENKASIRVVQKAGFVRVGARVDEEGEYVIQWLRRSGA